MRIITVRPGARCFDHFGTLTSAQAKALAADGFEGGFAYTATVTAADLAARLDAGLWVAFVLEGLSPSTMPTRELGARMAGAGSAVLRGLSVPQGPTIFADLESPGGVGTWSDWYAFGAGAGSATLGAGDIPGIYLAEGTGLTRDDISKLPAQRYWRGAARIVDRNGVPVDEPEFGWSVVQGLPIDATHSSGVQIDYDVAWQDRRGRAITAVAE